MYTWMLPLLALTASDDFMARIKESKTEALVILKEGKKLQARQPGSHSVDHQNLHEPGDWIIAQAGEALLH